MRIPLSEMSSRDFHAALDRHQGEQFDEAHPPRACRCDEEHCTVCFDWNEKDNDDETP
jgi:hypothetical protein